MQLLYHQPTKVRQSDLQELLLKPYLLDRATCQLFLRLNIYSMPKNVAEAVGFHTAGQKEGPKVVLSQLLWE